MEVHKESIETEKIGQNFEKDSKLCWWALACGFLTQVLILGVLHAFGVFFVEFIQEFNTTKGTAAWVGSIAYGISMFVGPVTGIMMKRFGHKLAMVLGGLLCSIALLASSFVESINLLFFTFSFIYGVGACMSITPTMTLGQDYFDKYLGVSVGIMTSGSSIGTLIMAPTTQALIDAIGWRNTFRVYAGTSLLTSVFNLFIRPITSRKKTRTDELRTSPLRRLIAELALWKNRVFIVWTVGITLVMFGYYIPYVHLVSFAIDKGATVEQGSIIIMVFGASTATGRLMFGKIVQLGLLNRLHMHQLSMILSGTATMFLPLISSYTGLLVYIVFFGLVDGCFVVLLPLMTCSLVRTDKVTLAWGFLVCSSSITFTLGPPVAGFMYDTLGSYNLPFHVAGVPVILGALVLFLIPWAQRTSDYKKDMEKIEEVVVLEPDDDVDYITLSRSSIYQGSQVTLAGSMRHSLRYGESLLSQRETMSPNYYRQRDIELPLAYSDRNSAFPSDMMSFTSRRTFDSLGRSIAKSGRDSRGVMSSRHSRNMAVSKYGSRRSDAMSVTSDDMRSATRHSIGIQTDDISITSSSYFLPSSSDIHCQYEPKITSTGTSMLENSITSGQIEPFVMEQIERLAETLSCPTRASELMENPSPQWINSPPDEVAVPAPHRPTASTPTSSRTEILSITPVAELKENPRPQWISCPRNEVTVSTSQTSGTSTSSTKEIVSNIPVSEQMENPRPQWISSSRDAVAVSTSQTSNTPKSPPKEIVSNIPISEQMENPRSQWISSPRDEVAVPIPHTSGTPKSPPKEIVSVTPVSEQMENPRPQWISSSRDEVVVPTSYTSSTSKSSPKEIAIITPVTFDELLVPAETVSCALSPKHSPEPSVIDRELLYKDESNTPTVSCIVEQQANIFPIEEERELTNPITEHAARSVSPIQEQEPIVSPLSTNPHNEQPNFLSNQEAFRTLSESTNEEHVIPVIADTQNSPIFSEFGKALQGTGIVKNPSPTSSLSGPSPPSPPSSPTETESESSSISPPKDEVSGSPDSQNDPIFKMENTPPKN